MALTAGTPTPTLIVSLEKAGWGLDLDLVGGRRDHGRRAVLGALARLLPHKAGQGTVTAEQVAASTGYSERWTRACLHALEDAGIITWRRGGILEGRPEPSFIRIQRAVLVELIHAARGAREVALAARRSVTAARVAGLRSLDVRSKPRKRHKPRSIHAEVGYSLPPQGEEPGPGGVPVGPPSTAESRAHWLKEARANLRRPTR